MITKVGDRRPAAATVARWMALVASVGLSVVAMPASAEAQLGRPVPEAVRDTGAVEEVTPAGMRPESVTGPSPGLAPGSEEPTAAPGLPAAVSRLERQILADVAADGVGSMAAAVVVGDSVVWQAAFGTADRDMGLLASPTTLYRAGSLAKPVTALALLALVERGVVALDDPVEPLVPELRRLANRSPDHPPITFRHLAAHTSGLDREPGTSRATRGADRTWQLRLAAALPATAVLAPPGERYFYSNVGYGVLGLALERAAGRPYQSLVRELVFEPLGMTSSYLDAPRDAWRRVAAGYVNPAPDSIDPRVPRAEHRGRGYRTPSDGLYSTVGDLARLAMAMSGALGDVVIGAGSREAALRDQVSRTDGPWTPAGASASASVATTGYGLGFQLHRIGDTVIAGHSGTVAGYAAYLAFDPDTRIGVVLLRNYNHGATNLGATAVRTVLELIEAADG
jgi:CubicO group peptidase (beta-lactamase class C family)